MIRVFSFLVVVGFCVVCVMVSEACCYGECLC